MRPLPSPNTRKLTIKTKIPAILAGLSELQNAGLRAESQKMLVEFDWSGVEVAMKEHQGAHPHLDVWAIFPYPDWLQERLQDESVEGGFASGLDNHPNLEAKIREAKYLCEEAFDHDVNEGHYYEWGTGIRARIPRETLEEEKSVEGKSLIIRQFLGDVLRFRRDFEQESADVKSKL